MVPNDVSTWARGRSHRDKSPGVVAAGIPSPVPNTRYKHHGSDKMITRGIENTITPPGGENSDHKVTELELTPTMTIWRRNDEDSQIQ